MRERTPLQFPQKTNLDFPSPQLTQSVGTDCTFGPTHTDRERPTRRQSTLCSPSRGRSALPQMVSSSQGGCSRLTHACIQAQTHVRACVHARDALASDQRALRMESARHAYSHTRVHASADMRACVRACTHTCVTMVSSARGGRCSHIYTLTHAHKRTLHTHTCTYIHPSIHTHAHS